MASKTPLLLSVCPNTKDFNLMKYAFLSAIFSMCTLETTKDTTIEGSDE